jgi:hypothetical protein
MPVTKRRFYKLIFALLFSSGSVLHALKERYQLREPYTYSGIVLVSVTQITVSDLCLTSLCGNSGRIEPLHTLEHL